MSVTFVDAFSAEWLKRRRSFASIMVIVGAFFTPMLIIVARLMTHDRLAAINASPTFWANHWKSSWESMAIFFLPIGAVLATSLVAQLEFKNNAWKQVHALPIHSATIYFSKLAVVLVMMLQFFVLLNVGIYLSAIVPALLVPGASLPQAPLPWRQFLRDDLLYFIDCLPIVAAQFAISVRLRNFLAPIGAGFVTWVAALAALPWKYNYVIPYTYLMLKYLESDTRGKAAMPPVDIHGAALVWFAIFTGVGFVMFAMQREKG